MGREPCAVSCEPRLPEGTLTSVKAHGRIGRKKAQESQRRDLPNLRRRRDLLQPRLLLGHMDSALRNEMGEQNA